MKHTGRHIHNSWSSYSEDTVIYEGCCSGFPFAVVKIGLFSSGSSHHSPKPKFDLVKYICRVDASQYSTGFNSIMDDRMMLIPTEYDNVRRIPPFFDGQVDRWVGMNSSSPSYWDRGYTKGYYVTTVIASFHSVHERMMDEIRWGMNFEDPCFYDGVVHTFFRRIHTLLEKIKIYGETKPEDEF